MFPFVLPAAIAICVLLYANYGSDSGADWLRAKTTQYAGPGFLKFATYGCAFLVS